MKVAVYSNVRTTISAQKTGWTACFNTAFRAGAVMGKISILAFVFTSFFIGHRYLTPQFKYLN
jgi:Na+/H+-translocating membrane pyrophosphatase